MLEQRRPLVVATGNPGKLREIRELLSALPFDVLGYRDVGLTAPEETGSSFMENAVLKARSAARQSGFAAIGDDSGLEVDALGGAPGVYSARFAGPAADDAANNLKLLAALARTPWDARAARYRCAVAYVAAGPDSDPLTAEGAWEGLILDTPRGSGGFGYDPYFWMPELKKTAAELGLSDKNRLSHRGAALRALRAGLAGGVGTWADP